ncbi:MAG: DUF2892 domain-containing protein [Pseudomonadales bacterium]|jgi:hypothetical protein|nr:DUF2892 domain-containing protein [Pseudomonadales bacterium]
MKQNVGIFDANLRIAFGAAIMVMLSIYGSAWALVGLVLMATGFKHWCPLYTPLGFNTCETK